MYSNDPRALLVSSYGSPPPPRHVHGDLGSNDPSAHTPLLRTCSETTTTYLSTSFTDTASDALAPSSGSSCTAAPPPASYAQSSNWGGQSISLTLENSGSVARDHLASERTFLAYIRTSLCVASVGVALAQLLTLEYDYPLPVPAPKSSLEIYARPLAVSFILLSLYVLLVGVSRYFCIQASLVRGVFPVSRLGLVGIVLALTALVVFVFGLLMVEGTSE
ncbi:hypothetical protein FB45DRAFT_1053596 [Roridomyces roridus]|uniref:DUF202 domain-containing protein n=1 Tax=Roridomyces roridus TaxID=1738132 RepID=A0AAD7CCN3_9AGAR|nr:hypothetical protein FB45DRAFT_1053596 [Roridomyces roridus]